MPTYLLDTNIISYLADPAAAEHDRVAQAVTSLADDCRLTISLLTLYELAYGQVRGEAGARLLAIVRDAGVEVCIPTVAGADLFARLKDAYRRHTGGRPRDLVRHNVDFILASTALVEGAVLVSNDAIFVHLAALEPTLSVENWAA